MAKTAPESTTSPRLDALLAEVRDRTSQHGDRAVLAEILGITPNRLSEYLALPPVRRPNGEMTLSILDWLGKGRRKK